MSTAYTPIQAEKDTASSVRKVMNWPMKSLATSIMNAPPTRLMIALMLTAMARGSLTPMVCAVKPAEYIDRLLISSIPTSAVSR